MGIKCYVCHDPLLKFDMICMNDYDSLCHARCYDRSPDLAKEWDTFKNILIKHPYFGTDKGELDVKAVVWYRK